MNRLLLATLVAIIPGSAFGTELGETLQLALKCTNDNRTEDMQIFVEKTHGSSSPTHILILETNSDSTEVRVYDGSDALSVSRLSRGIAASFNVTPRPILVDSPRYTVAVMPESASRAVLRFESVEAVAHYSCDFLSSRKQ